MVRVFPWFKIKKILARVYLILMHLNSRLAKTSNVKILKKNIVFLVNSTTIYINGSIVSKFSECKHVMLCIQIAFLGFLI